MRSPIRNADYYHRGRRDAEGPSEAAERASAASLDIEGDERVTGGLGKDVTKPPRELRGP